MSELAKLLKFTEAILIKKIGASIKFMKEENTEFEYELDYTLFDKEKLAELCFELENKVKAIKAVEQTNKMNLALQQQRIEEEERAIKLAEKMQKEQFVIDNSIVDCNQMDRLKFRFFNLATYDDEDPEGLNPLYSPPFYETKEQQFSEELIKSSFKVYAATYNGETMSGKPLYMQKNLNKSFASMVEDSQYIKMLFVSFRTIVENDVCRYESVWISNIKQDLSTIGDFDNFEFVEKDKNTIEFNMLENEILVEQIFAR
jgi:hypothetical protein